MKTVRLLPVVIFAAVALLVFKSFGLVTNGGYVLLGTNAAEAAGAAGAGVGRGAHDDLTKEQMASMIEPTMEDTDPTADDTAPTLPIGGQQSAGHGAPAAADAAAHGETEVAPAAPPADTKTGSSVAPEVVCPPVVLGESAEEGGDHGAASAEGGAAAGPAAVVPEGCVSPSGDALPVVRDAQGNLVPYSSGGTAEEALLERLGQRRTELDAREQELDMRMALVKAAEKRINERTAVLQQLEARIDALVDQTQEAEKEQFKGIIAMYETMKPKEAASIFDELDLNTLLRVARAMNPRKMSPIMAKMNPTKAKDL
ncbi:MAG TPA: hypothetical protein VIN06_10950, partial [Devosia sp.]